MTLRTEDLTQVKSFLERELRGFGSLPVPAEDLAAEVMLRLLAANAARPIASPFAYARTILLNIVRDRIRQFERAHRALAVLSNRLRGRANHCDRSTDDSDLVGYLLQTTDLSPPQHQVIRMVYLDSKTITDVARELGKNPGTIQRHHDRALEKLASRAAHLRLSE